MNSKMSVMSERDMMKSENYKTPTQQERVK